MAGVAASAWRGYGVKGVAWRGIGKSIACWRSGMALALSGSKAPSARRQQRHQRAVIEHISVIRHGKA